MNRHARRKVVKLNKALSKIKATSVMFGSPSMGSVSRTESLPRLRSAAWFTALVLIRTEMSSRSVDRAMWVNLFPAKESSDITGLRAFPMSSIFQWATGEAI